MRSNRADDLGADQGGVAAARARGSASPRISAIRTRAGSGAGEAHCDHGRARRRSPAHDRGRAGVGSALASADCGGPEPAGHPVRTGRSVDGHSGEAAAAAGLLSLSRSLRNEATLLSLGDQGSQPVHIDLRARVGVALRMGAGEKRCHLGAVKDSNDFLQSGNQLRREGSWASPPSVLSGPATCSVEGALRPSPETNSTNSRSGSKSRPGRLRGEYAYKALRPCSLAQ